MKCPSCGWDEVHHEDYRAHSNEARRMGQEMNKRLIDALQAAAWVVDPHDSHKIAQEALRKEGISGPWETKTT